VRLAACRHTRSGSWAAWRIRIDGCFRRPFRLLLESALVARTAQSLMHRRRHSGRLLAGLAGAGRRRVLDFINLPAPDCNVVCYFYRAELRAKSGRHAELAALRPHRHPAAGLGQRSLPAVSTADPAGAARPRWRRWGGWGGEVSSTFGGPELLRKRPQTIVGTKDDAGIYLPVNATIRILLRCPHRPSRRERCPRELRAAPPTRVRRADARPHGW
jgi:hypothetical protein